ncbi:sensor histidine kinase N-terminal domain-containing protein [Leptospira sp. 96542]|nr:sensor histidine kinase N-terminal domain-containing protein [Leptospira sp. 96542]
MVWPLGLAWCLGTVFMLGLARHFTEAAFDRALLDDAYAIASHFRGGPGGEVSLKLSTSELKAALFDHVESVHFAIFDPAGQRLVGEPLQEMALAPGQAFRYDEYMLADQPVRAVALRHVVDQKTYTVVMAHTTRARGELEARLLYFAALPQLLFLGLLVLWLRRIIDQDLEPLSQLRGTLARRDVHDLSGITVSASTQEIEQLGRTISQLFERLERGARAQREFAGNVAHELRTPLAGMRALTDYGLAQDDPAVHRQQLAQVRRSVDRASRLVDQLLGLALANEGELALQPRRLQPAELLREAVLRHLGRADAQGVDLGARGLDDAALESLAILADPALVEAMLDNLIDNALRYGGRTLTLALSRSADARHCALAVIDDGPGIPVAQRHALLQRWRQGGAGQRLGQGAGLGLSIVARFAELSGAEFTLADAPGPHGLHASLRFALAIHLNDFGVKQTNTI